MEEDFIATIKLTTGEELISKVSYMPDDDSLVLDSPMEVTKIDTTKQNPVSYTHLTLPTILRV